MKKIEKVEKLVCSIEDKDKYVIHIRALKQASNNGLKLTRGTQNNYVSTKSMVKDIYWYEHKIKKRSKKWIWKRFL